MTEEGPIDLDAEPQAPDNLTELDVLLGRLVKLIEIHEWEIDRSNSDAFINARKRRLEELNAHYKALSDLKTGLAKSESEDDLVTYAKQQNKRLSDSVNVAGNTFQAQKRQEAADALSEAIVFIEDERANSSDRQIELKSQEMSAYAAKAEQEQSNSDAAEASEVKDNILLESINERGTGIAHTSIPQKYSPKGYAGFVNFGDQAWEHKIEMHLKSTRFIAEEDKKELLLLEPWMEPKFESEVVSPAKKGIFGIGAKAEQRRQVQVGEEQKRMSDIIDGEDSDELAYHLFYEARGGRDFSGREGQVLRVEIAIPESLAKKVEARLKQDPNFIRKIAKARVAKYFKENNPNVDFEKVWNDGDNETHNFPLSPPFDKWDAEGIRMQTTIKD